jgi:hypothetical protein
LDWVWQTVDESYTTNKIPFTGLSGSKKKASVLRLIPSFCFSTPNWLTW